MLYFLCIMDKQLWAIAEYRVPFLPFGPHETGPALPPHDSVCTVRLCQPSPGSSYARLYPAALRRTKKNCPVGVNAAGCPLLMYRHTPIRAEHLRLKPGKRRPYFSMGPEVANFNNLITIFAFCHNAICIFCRTVI